MTGCTVRTRRDGTMIFTDESYHQPARYHHETRVDRDLVHARAAELRASMPEREWRR